jgi:hypothetical protein
MRNGRLREVVGFRPISNMNNDVMCLFFSAMGSDCGLVNVNIPTNGAEIGGAFGMFELLYYGCAFTASAGCFRAFHPITNIK